MGDARPSSPFIHDSPDSSDVHSPDNGGVSQWFKQTFLQRSPQPELPQSNYLTLVPLSDARLRPRNTALLVTFLVFLGIVAVVTVFVLVPRGLSIGEITVESDTMSWNTTKRTYQLRLKATIPVANPNYVAATLNGRFKVQFYDTEAGETLVKNVVVPARSSPYVLHVDVDASNVPSDYTLTILKECASFPRRLIFFQKIDLQVLYLGQHQKLPVIDSYFMIDCINGGAVPSSAPYST